MGAPVTIPTSVGINTLLTQGQEQSKTWNGPASEVTRWSGSYGKDALFSTSSVHSIRLLSPPAREETLPPLPPPPALNPARLHRMIRQFPTLSTGR